jgi:hypothetical protein
MSEQYPSLEKETSYVNDEGRTIVDVHQLLRSPKVRETLRRISLAQTKLKHTKGVVVPKRPDRSPRPV